MQDHYTKTKLLVLCLVVSLLAGCQKAEDISTESETDALVQEQTNAEEIHTEPYAETTTTLFDPPTFPIPSYWEDDMLALFETEILSQTDTGSPVYVYRLYEYLAHTTDAEKGLVWSLWVYNKADFSETALDEDAMVLGQDGAYVYVLTLPTDRQWLADATWEDAVRGKIDSQSQYERLQFSSSYLFPQFLKNGYITPNANCPTSAVYDPTMVEMSEEVIVDADALWTDFLETLTPYESYVYATESLDLDGNGVDELLVYESGMGTCEVFTIEDGEVRSLYSGDFSLATAYVGEQKRLAPASANAIEDCFGSFYGNKTMQDAFMESTRVNRKTGKHQYVQFTDYGNVTGRNSRFYVFSMDQNGYLQVHNPYSFQREAVRSNPDQGWYCFQNGTQMTMAQYKEAVYTMWDEIAETYGVQYSEENQPNVLRDMEHDVPQELATLLSILTAKEAPKARISLRIPEPGLSLYSANGFGYEGADTYSGLFKNHTYMLADNTTEPDGTVSLLSVMAEDWTLYFWQDSTLVKLSVDENDYYFETEASAYADVKEWLDVSLTAENLRLHGEIEDVGQTYLEAAQAWWENQMAAQSHIYTYAKVTVEDLPNQEELVARELLPAGVYGYTMTMIVVPTEDRYVMGMSHYEEDAPDVPEGAYIISYFCYMTLEDGIWKSTTLGTGL